MNCSESKTIVIAICGASGALYGIRLLKALLERNTHVYLIVSSAGKSVLKHECGYKGEAFEEFLCSKGIHPIPQATLTILDEHDFFTPPASGSFRHDGMVIAPCTMGTLGAIAAGLASNLIQRAADVCLKEKHPLILLPRETPLSTIHLTNMLKVTRAGATIMPPCPSFYTGAQSIDDLVDTVVARALDHLGIEQNLVKPWAQA
ncbi:MAG: UbiX family flavin prenyltransferase [Proteobacteria bacterium]|nr:UbiX family flavin prenyltransferase [Pseudomonadota bacterium]